MAVKTPAIDLKRVLQLLALAEEPVRRNTTLIKLHMSWAQQRHYLPWLLARGFLEYDSNTQKFHVTARGRELVSMLEEPNHAVA